jgi:hypothetical protein
MARFQCAFDGEQWPVLSQPFAPCAELANAMALDRSLDAAGASALISVADDGMVGREDPHA